MGRADLHVHTTWSDGLGTPAQIVEAAVRRGLDVIAVTDHDRFEGARAAREYARAHGYQLDVIGGMEITTAWGRHLVALFVDGPFGLYRPAAEILLEVADRGGLCVIPHPFTRMTPSFGRGAIEALLTHGLPVAGIERCNPTPAGRPAGRLAPALSLAWDLAEVGASDAHFANRVGDAYTLFPGRNGDDLRQALVTRQTVASFRVGAIERVAVSDYARQLSRSFVRSPLRKSRLAGRALAGLIGRRIREHADPRSDGSRSDQLLRPVVALSATDRSLATAVMDRDDGRWLDTDVGLRARAHTPAAVSTLSVAPRSCPTNAQVPLPPAPALAWPRSAASEKGSANPTDADPTKMP